MSDKHAHEHDVKFSCECAGCNAKTHEGGVCRSDYKADGRFWERRSWADQIDRLLCPECWQDVAANQTPQPGLVS